MSKLRLLTKNIIAYTLYYSGIILAILKYKTKNKLIVLTYHRVMPDDVAINSFSNKAIIVKPETFEKHIIFLKNHFNVVSLEEFSVTLKSQYRDNKPLCLITFDDGWIDNYIYAFPIIKKHRIPVTIFLPTDYINSNKLFWQENIAMALKNLLASKSDAANNILCNLHLQHLRTLSNDQALNKILSAVNKLKTKSYNEIKDLHNRIINATNSNTIEKHIDRYINWDIVNEMKESGISFGSHACSHRILTRLDQDTVTKELIDSSKIIEEKTGLKPFAIAYPNGNADNNVIKCATNSGYELGFTTKPGYINPNSNPLSHNRLNMHEKKSSNTPLFVMSLLGYF